MNGALTALGIVAAGVIGFLLGRKRKHPHIRTGGASDASLFRTLRGTDGFCTGEVLKKRMKGRRFHWKRVGGCQPEAGSRFEIRLKDPTMPNPLIPSVPFGVDDIWADVDPDEPEGTVYPYGLFQVLADGRERELEDPELEIGHI
jgi:LPXTG-motif cell wall-anchored protein